MYLNQWGHQQEEDLSPRDYVTQGAIAPPSPSTLPVVVPFLFSSSFMPNPSDWIEIGKIVAPQGLVGELRVYPSSDFPERFLEPGQRWMRSPKGGDPTLVHLQSGRYVEGKNLYVIRLEGITSRAQAETLRDYELLVPESDRLPLDPHEFHVADLIGLTVIDQHSQDLVGTVVDVMSTGHDMLVVERPSSGTPEPEEPVEPTPHHPDRRKSAKTPRAKKRQTPPLLIPFVEAIVPVVDLEQQRIEITPPEGLLD
ncbi:MAG: ribosome maturation factor RimM [Elainellaceae cyanobacterium]|jgi:16S rRNA processing protein RimM